MEENRERMWIFILLYFLGSNISQANGQVSDNSTQMYFVKLTIEQSAINNITEILKPFVSNATLHVDDLQITTTCQNVSAGTECSCAPRNRWSDKMCKSNQECCGNEKCILPENSSPMCVSNDTVTITGSVVLKKLEYDDCLTDKNSMQYQQCNSELLEKIKTVYSTLRGFDILTITAYREVGHIIADFEMTIAYSVQPQDLINKSVSLSKSLPATLHLETRGIVHLIMPPNPVCYYSQHVLTCTVQVDLNTPPSWQLRKGDAVFHITNGTESVVTSETMATTVTVRNVSKIWAGEYTCAYHQNSKEDLYTITHKASAVLNVSLLPDIDIYATPSFPRCQKSSDFLNVKVQCETESSNENYMVTWEDRGITAEIIPVTRSTSERKDVHAAKIIVSCDSPNNIPQLTCTFKNRCNQIRTASVDINIIYENDLFCEAEGDWKDTKAGFTAVLKCKNAAGQRQRKCQTGSDKATWESEVSACVNQEVHNVLHKAAIVGIGLGSLDENAAHVFSILDNITNNTQSINTFPNLNASVQVLFTLSQHDLQPNESVADDILESSSNLLEKSLNKSWETKADEGNMSLAERYLDSVGQLIHMSNVTGITKKKNVEVEARNCSQGSQCTNRVFNASIRLDSPDTGSVKTAGFRELEKYLPNNVADYEPNSIVLSTTMERKQSDSVGVEITFELLKTRPRNVEIQCVSWDSNTRGWSQRGCKWGGPSNEAHCVCSHLSSFAILMSKTPLNIPWINEITDVGLSVSVMSLIVSLAIELTVWSTVVKTNNLYLRHTAHINISLCLLVADCCFLACSRLHKISLTWQKTFVMLKHFCYLSMFFWMLCLSTALLHQAVFMFHNVSKKNYMRFSLVVGYVCPLLIVMITVISNRGGAEGLYFSRETCWLVYTGVLKGSIYTFVIPVGIIVFVNVFSMLVVIMKLLDRPKNPETSQDKEKKAVITVIRSVILLTPVFGVTWIFGFAGMFLDLTSGVIPFVVGYTFTLLNGFQGLFILLTTCLGDKLTRAALLNRLKKRAPASTNGSSTTLDSTVRK